MLIQAIKLFVHITEKILTYPNEEISPKNHTVCLFCEKFNKRIVSVKSNVEH